MEHHVLLFKLLESEVVILLLLKILELLDHPRINVHVGLLRIVVITYLLMLTKSPVDFARKVEAAVEVSGAQSEVLEAVDIPHLLEGPLRWGLSLHFKSKIIILNRPITAIINSGMETESRGRKHKESG